MFSSMFYLWTVERLYLDIIVLGNKRRGRSPPAAVAGCSFVHSGSLLHLSRSYFGCTPKMPGVWAASTPPHPSGKAHWSHCMSDLHSWFHIRFIKGGIQEVLSRTKDDDERESFFLIVLERFSISNALARQGHIVVHHTPRYGSHQMHSTRSPLEM